MRDDADDPIERAATIQVLAASHGLFAAARTRLLDAAAVGAGDRVLEVGCGTFAGARDLALRVGGHGRIVGVDALPRFLTRAAEHLRAPARLVVGDAEHPPFAAGSFDVALLDKLLSHLEDPRLALRRTARLLRGGGRLGAFEWDLAGIRVRSGDVELDEVLAEVQRLTTANPEAPIRVGAWLRQAGLEDVTVEKIRIDTRRLDELWREFLRADLDAARRLGLADRARTEDWWETLERRDRGGEFRAASAGVIAAGRRPGNGTTGHE